MGNPSTLTVWQEENRKNVAIILYSCWVFGTLFITIISLARLSPDTLNWALRLLICFFNTTYPFTSVAGLFWMIIPPYVALNGQFPFQLNAQYAIVGSMILKLFEFKAVDKLQSASQLDEHSIAMTQKMDKVSDVTDETDVTDVTDVTVVTGMWRV